MRTIAALLLLLTSFAQALPTISRTSPSLPIHHALRETEYRVVTTTSYGDHVSSVSVIPDPASEPCASTRNPIPRSTPNPILNTDGWVTVNFVITTDGRVWSPLILESNGNQADDRATLRVVTSWKYRPATCNGVPTEAEAVVAIHQ